MHDEISQSNDPDNGKERHKELELKMPRLMMIILHGQSAADPAAKGRKKQKCIFRYSPFMAFCLMFIPAVQDKGNKINGT